jgi:hypothetical protein
MSKLVLFIIILFATGCSDRGTSEKEVAAHTDSTAARPSPDNSKKSIPSETKRKIGRLDLTITYHAPAVRGRSIWGGLVPYNEVWVTGAHKATALEASTDFRIGDKKIPAGKYALFTIPGKEKWTVMINRNWNQHLADDYSQKDDLVRFNVTPEWKEENMERLTYKIEQTGNRTGIILIGWEKLRLPVRIESVE